MAETLTETDGLHRKRLVYVIGVNGKSDLLPLDLVRLDGNNPLDFMGLDVRDRSNGLDTDVLNLLGLYQFLNWKSDVLGSVFIMLHWYDPLHVHFLNVLNRCNSFYSHWNYLLALDKLLDRNFDGFCSDLLSDDGDNLLDLESLHLLNGFDRLYSKLLDFLGFNQLLYRDGYFLLLNAIFLDRNGGADGVCFVALNRMDRLILQWNDLFRLDVSLDRNVDPFALDGVAAHRHNLVYVKVLNSLDLSGMT